MSARLPWALLLLCAVGCEELRPAVEVPPPHRGGDALARALRLKQRGEPLPEVCAALREVIAGSGSEDQVERARRLLVQAHAEWYQLAHIAKDLLPDLPSAASIFTTLKSDLDVPADRAFEPTLTSEGRPSRNPTAGRRLPIVEALISPGAAVTRPADVKRALETSLTTLQESPEPETRRFAAMVQRFVSIETAWRYGAAWSSTPARVRELLRFAGRADAPALADNAWLMLRVSMAVALRQPAVPRRALMESIATLLDTPMDPSRRESPRALLLRIGGVESGSLPERIWASWRAVRLAVAERLESLGVAPADSDGRRTWNQLRRYLGLRPPLDRPDVLSLYALGEPLRVEAVTDWLRELNLAPLRTDRGLDRLEATVRTRLADPDADRRSVDALRVMTLLAVQEAVVARLGPRTHGPAVRLVDRGRLLERSLLLPGGGLYEAFARKVFECLKPRQPLGCLRRIVVTLERRSARPE